jgi:hypothetical protein
MKVEKGIPYSQATVSSSKIIMEEGDSVFFTDAREAGLFYQRLGASLRGGEFRPRKKRVDGGIRIWKLRR